MFGLTNIGKENDKKNYVYSGYGIEFDGKGEWNYSNDLARNAIIFGVDNTFVINGRFGATEKKIILILVKQRQNFAWVCIIILIIVIYLWTKKKSINLKLAIKILTFRFSFV